ncbi:MAG: hypothetical protein KDC61_18280, partial [Saprospiraceae bacterium]|nr:hypothetical protein [Saprospiraceae bacterium]
MQTLVRRGLGVVLLQAWIFLFSLPFYAQTISSLPRLEPSYSEDFSDYNSYPSTCFQDAFMDQDGRLWLVVCDQASRTNGMYLFQFDGYQFKLVEGALGELRLNCYIEGLYQGHYLVGKICEEGNNRIFFYDLQTGRLNIKPVVSTGILEKVIITDSDRIYLTLLEGGTVRLCEWKDGRCLEQSRFDAPVLTSDFLEPETLYHDERFFWGIVRHKGYFIRLNKSSGAIKKFNFNEFLPQNHQYNPHGIFHMEFADILLQKGKVHLFFQMWKTPSWYQLDPETDRFRPVSAVPAGAIGSVLARDRVGNLVFVYKNAQ